MSIDLNEAFRNERMSQIEYARTAAERAEQRNADTRARFDERIAQGKLRNLGNGMFKVTDPGSYDDGEVLRLRMVDVDGYVQQQILPVHGLDETTGAAALYTRVPAWHELGVVVPQGLTSIDEVMELARINFMVGKTPVNYFNAVTQEMEILDGSFVTTRSDTGKGLGVVGNSYEIFQNHEAFEFLEALVDRYGVVWESAGALRGGARVFVCMRLPQEIRIDPNGVNDEILPFVVLTTTHDGSGKVEAMVTPWRPVCGNTERFAVRDATVRWGTRHTKNIKDKVAEARRTMAQSVAYFEKFVVEEQRLAETELLLNDFTKLIEDVWGELDASPTAKAVTMRAKLTETLVETWEENTKVLGRTAYAAERAITEYADWKRGLKPRSAELRGNHLATRATAMLEDSAGDLKSRTHRKLMLRVGGGTQAV